MAGHRAGLYMPADLPESLFRIEGMLVVGEGATDAVIGLGMGMWTVGRFSCTHGATLLARLVGRLRPACVVLVGDTDGPGQRGVESLASALLPYVRALKVTDLWEPFQIHRQAAERERLHPHRKQLDHYTPNVSIAL